MLMNLTGRVDTSTWTTTAHAPTFQSMLDHLRGWTDTVVSSPALATLVVLLAALVVARILARVLRLVIVRMTRRTRNRWDDLLADALAGPLSACIVLVTFTVTLPWIPV